MLKNVLKFQKIHLRKGLFVVKVFAPYDFPSVPYSTTDISWKLNEIFGKRYSKEYPKIPAFFKSLYCIEVRKMQHKKDYT